MADEVCLVASVDVSPPPKCPQSAVSLTDVVHHPFVPVTDDHDLSVLQIPLIHDFDDGTLRNPNQIKDPRDEQPQAKLLQFFQLPGNPGER